MIKKILALTIERKKNNLQIKWSKVSSKLPEFQ